MTQHHKPTRLFFAGAKIPRKRQTNVRGGRTVRAPGDKGISRDESFAGARSKLITRPKGQKTCGGNSGRGGKEEYRRKFGRWKSYLKYRKEKVDIVGDSPQRTGTKFHEVFVNTAEEERYRGEKKEGLFLKKQGER